MLSNTIRKVGFTIWTICIVVAAGLLATLTTQAETDQDAILPNQPIVESGSVTEIIPEKTPDPAIISRKSSEQPVDSGARSASEPVAENTAVTPAEVTSEPTAKKTEVAPTEATTAPITEVLPENNNGPMGTDKVQTDAGVQADEKITVEPKGWVDMFGSLHTQEITIEGPRLTINLPGKQSNASFNIAVDEKKIPLGQMMSKLAFKKIHIKKGTFVFRTPSGFTQTVYAVDATLTGDKNSSISTARGQFEFRGQKISFEISAAKPTGEGTAGIIPINVLLSGENLNVQLAGSINLHDDLEIKGKLKLAMGDLKFISAWLGYPLSNNSQTTRMDADGQFSWRGSVLSFSDAQFDIGNSEATGAISIDMADARPRLDATMAFDQVDLQEIFKARRLKTSRGARNSIQSGQSLDSVSPDESLAETQDITEQYSDFAHTYLSGFDANIRLSAERLQFSKIEAQDCAITLTLQSGDLLIGLVESKFAGGSAHGELSLKNESTGRVSNLRANLENVQTDILAGIFELPSLIKGPAHIKLDVTGKGQGWAKITKTLSGEMKIHMNGPVQIGDGAEYIKFETKDTEVLKWWLDIRDGYRFQSYKNVFKLKNGMISTLLFGLRGSEMTIDGSGTIDLANRTGNIILHRGHVKGENGNRVAKFDDKSADIVKIHGAWDNLLISPATTSLVPDNDNSVPHVPGRQGADTGSDKKSVADSGPGNAG